MATVAKRKWTHNGVEKTGWVVRYTDQRGKRVQKKAGSKKEADALRLKIEMEIEGGVHTADRAAPTFGDVCGHFLRECERRHKHEGTMTGHTVAGYRSKVEIHLVPRFGRIRVALLGTDDFQAMAEDMRITHAVSSVRQIVLAAERVLDFAVKRKWIKRNALRDNPVVIREGKRKRPRIPTKDEMKALLEAAWTLAHREKRITYVNRIAVVSLGLFGGLRAGEMSGLQWENVDFAAGVIRIEHSFSKYDGLKDPKTAAGIREVPMSRPIRLALEEVLRYWQSRAQVVEQYVPDNKAVRHARLLRRAIERQDFDLDFDNLPSGYVLKTTRDKPLTSYNTELWKPLMESAGLVDDGKARFSMHKMRHAAASLFIEAGLPAMNLKAVIGHSNVSTTYNVYGHLFPDDRRAFAASDAIAAAFAATSERQISVTH